MAKKCRTKSFETSKEALRFANKLIKKKPYKIEVGQYVKPSRKAGKSFVRYCSLKVKRK